MSTEPAPAPVYAAPREWTRVHPISPYLGTGPILGAVVVFWIARITPSWVAGDSDEIEAAAKLPFLALAGLVVLAIVGVIGYGLLSWRRNEFRIGDDAIYNRKGIVFRQHKQARLDRIEAVDVVQPLLARLFGLAQVTVSVAGGQGSEVELKYLRLGDGEALRNEILALAAGSMMPDAVAGSAPAASLRDLATNLGVTRTETAVAAAPEHDLFTVPVKRLLVSILLSGPTIFVVAAVAAAGVAAVVLGQTALQVIAGLIGTSLFAAVAFLAAIFSFFWNRLNSGFRFTASTSADGLRLRHGLLETRRQTVTPGRVQAVRVHQPWLWRRKGWYRITMNVAGYHEDQERVSTLLPVGPLDDALLALWLVLPDVTDRNPEGEMARALVGTGAEDGFVPSPQRARLVDPWQWRQRGVRPSERALLIRSGRFSRELMVVPNSRTQSLGVTQGPLQRLRHLASLKVHSTPGPVSPIAYNLDADMALDLLDAQAERARVSRSAHA